MILYYIAYFEVNIIWYKAHIILPNHIQCNIISVYAVYGHTTENTENEFLFTFSREDFSREDLSSRGVERNTCRFIE
jgi:hypothetical protein